MKKLMLTLFTIALFASANAQDIKWMTLDEALTAQKSNPKPIFMEVYTNWCGECKKMDKKTFKDKKLAAFISENYYAVKFNAESNVEVTYKGRKYSNPEFDATKKAKAKNATHDFVKLLKIDSYPTIVILEGQGEVSNTFTGFRTAAQLLPEL
ncbi:thioredoxin family protein [Flavobacterium sp.]|uniref:thioredoxin family protein n=1 Tax=Flavobacterium sp. TaxID=239 RepID=UPI0026364E2F|nr:thioredoxin family protein [Flavobacterium sp.]